MPIVQSTQLGFWQNQWLCVSIRTTMKRHHFGSFRWCLTKHPLLRALFWVQVVFDWKVNWIPWKFYLYAKVRFPEFLKTYTLLRWSFFNQWSIVSWSKSLPFFIVWSGCWFWRIAKKHILFVLLRLLEVLIYSYISPWLPTPVHCLFHMNSNNVHWLIIR